MDEAQRRDDRWIQQMHNAWRNERLAQEQVQQDEEEEERQRWDEQRGLLQRQLRSENITNNMSGQNVQDYQAQIFNNANPSGHPPSPPLPRSPPRSLPPSRSPSPPPPLPPPRRQVQQSHVPRARAIHREPVARHSLGHMNDVCPQCGALHFASERLSRSTINEAKFGMCCLSGQVVLPAFPPAPRELRELFDGTSPYSLDFKTNIRQYNAAFAFTSLGVKVDQTVIAGSGAYSFRISGELHHLSGSLLPVQGDNPAYAQIYIHDPAAQLAQREGNNENLTPAVMRIIQGAINQSHPHIHLYRQAYEIMRQKPPEEQHTVAIQLRAERHQDLRRYNLPTADDEVAAIIPGDGSEERSDHRDIVLRLRGGGLRRISHLHPSYSTLHYVLLFPNGEDGWHPDIPARMGRAGRGRSQNVTQRCYYAHRLHPRPGIQPLLLWGGNLFQQYVVDAWASVEQNTLNWVKHHQKELRADVYSGLRDAALGDRDNNLNLAEHGHRIILPSSFSGGERHMNQLFQDSMAICRTFRKPDIFITMTENPNWPEIQEQLLWEVPPNAGANHQRRKQKASDRPDIVARVFELKKNELLKDINKHGILGKVVASVHTIEFQKRGLPHMHLLIFLDEPDKIHTAEQVDTIVSAQLPDPELHPRLYHTVTNCMLHGPCGDAKPEAPCMVNGKCSKHYPKEFSETTTVGENGYPQYARPNNGRTFEKRGFVYDNRWVVPYNAYLSEK